MKPASITARVEISVQVRNKVYAAGPDTQAELVAFSNDAEEITLGCFVRTSERSIFEGKAYAVLDTQAAQTLTIALIEHLGAFPALLERLGITEADLKVGPTNVGTAPLDAKGG